LPKGSHSLTDSPAVREQRDPKPHMYYTYILVDDSQRVYIGYSGDLKKRIHSHLNGDVKTTYKFENPKLFYYEAYISKQQARVRELKLKQYGSSYSGLLKRLGLK
jgi:predicted GIY-YIG superfamily endonuclease